MTFEDILFGPEGEEYPQPTPSELPSPPYVSDSPGKLATAVGHYAKSFIPQIDWKEMNQKVDLSQAEFPKSLPPFQEALGVSGARPFPMEFNPMSVPSVGYVMEAPPGSQERMDRGVALGMDLLGAARGFSRGGTGIPRPAMKRIWTPEKVAEMQGASTAMRNSPSGSGLKYESPLPPRRGTDYMKSLEAAIDDRHPYAVVNIFKNAERDEMTLRVPPELLNRLPPALQMDYQRHVLTGIQRDLAKIMGKGQFPGDFDPDIPPWEQGHHAPYDKNPVLWQQPPSINSPVAPPGQPYYNYGNRRWPLDWHELPLYQQYKLQQEFGPPPPMRFGQKVADTADRWMDWTMGSRKRPWQNPIDDDISDWEKSLFRRQP